MRYFHYLLIAYLYFFEFSIMNIHYFCNKKNIEKKAGEVRRSSSFGREMLEVSV